MMYADKQEFYKKFPQFKRAIAEENFKKEMDSLVKVLTDSYEALLLIDLELDEYQMIAGLREEYAVSENAEFIVLDDPISSFDTNKKYAIIHRMFSKPNGRFPRSFYKKTVLMLTHDFEPIIDFGVVGKLPAEAINMKFIKNCGGELKELPIDVKTDIKPIYNVLSSLIHGRDKCKYADNTEIPIYNKQKEDAEIKIWISDFDYEKLYIEMYNEKKLAELYNSETNNYLKVQLFRAIFELNSNIEIGDNDVLINGSYHNSYFLDVVKFETVPEYIINAIDDYMKKTYKYITA